jgi:hypothetical protein
MEQLGLLGELLILEKYVLALFPASESLSFWLGPLGAPQDFIIRRIGIESKARGARDSTHVRINSAYQLDDSRISKLFLHLCVFESVQQDFIGDSFTLTEVVTRLREESFNSNEVIREKYDALMAAAGFRYEDDYSAFRWIGGERSIYTVDADFPKLTPAGLPAAITDVQYDLSLTECSNYLISPEALATVLTGEIA